MEAAIPVPLDALARANKRAAELRMTPTEFVAAALAHYLAYQDSLNLTHDINEILASIGQADEPITGTAA